MLEYIKGAEVLGTVNEKRCLMAYSIGIQMQNSLWLENVIEIT